MKEEKGLSIPEIGFLQSGCFFLFAGAAKILEDGNYEFFLTLGAIAFIFGVITGFFLIISKIVLRKPSRHSRRELQEIRSNF